MKTLLPSPKGEGKDVLRHEDIWGEGTSAVVVVLTNNPEYSGFAKRPTSAADNNPP